MKAEDYFIIAFIFGFVALLAVVFRNDPLFFPFNQNVFSIGYVSHGLETIWIYYSTIAFLILVPCVYFFIAFLIGGIAKFLLKKRKKHVS